MNNKKFKLIDDSIKRVLKETANSAIITSESDFKCYLYSKIKYKMGKRFLVKKYGEKYPALITEIEYSSTKVKKNYIADLILLDIKDIKINDDDFEIKKPIEESIAIELKFKDYHYKKDKVKALLNDCKKLIDSGNIRKGCVILYDIDKTDGLNSLDLEKIKNDLINDYKAKIKHNLKIVFYYINGKILLKEKFSLP